MDEIRKAGDYTIKHSMQIGGREVVLGENMDDANGHYYLVADFESNEIFERYINAFVSNDYVKIAKIYTDRISEEIDKLIDSRKNMSMNLISEEHCIPIGEKTFVEEIIVIKPTKLSPEYRNEHFQIVRCTGGNGANARGLGTSVFAKEMYSGKEFKYRRASVMGILKPEHYPGWLVDALECEKAMSNPNTFQYGEYHFLPVGNIPKNEPIYKTSQYLHSDKDMRMWSETYEGVHGKADKIYSHSDFYKASGNSKCDVFKCLENRNLYLPGENELFKYTGKYKAVGKEKKKSHKEVER